MFSDLLLDIERHLYIKGFPNITGCVKKYDLVTEQNLSAAEEDGEDQIEEDDDNTDSEVREEELIALGSRTILFIVSILCIHFSCTLC